VIDFAAWNIHIETDYFREFFVNNSSPEKWKFHFKNIEKGIRQLEAYRIQFRKDGSLRAFED